MHARYLLRIETKTIFPKLQRLRFSKPILLKLIPKTTSTDNIYDKLTFDSDATSKKTIESTPDFDRIGLE